MGKGMRGGFSRHSSGGSGMNFGGGNMQQMLKQAQHMQAEMEKEQAELADKTFEGTAGGGAVKITMKGDRKVESVEIKPEVVDPDDIEMLQDLVMAAFNDGITQIDAENEERMGKYTANLPV